MPSRPSVGQHSDPTDERHTTAADPPSGGTRWAAFGLAAGGGLAMAAVLGGLTMNGVLAASFAVAGDNFQLSVANFEGQGFAKYGDIASPVEEPDVPVALATVDSAVLTDMCMSALLDLPVGEATLLITAGEVEPVTGSSMVLDIEQLQGNASFSDIDIGRDASTLDVSANAAGPAGAFGLQAQEITVENMELTSWAVTAGSLNMHGLGLSVRPGNHECF